MRLQPFHYLVIFVFIVIIYIASQFLRLDEHPTEGIVLLSAAGAILIGFVLASETEHFYLPAGTIPSSEVADGDDLNINEDEYEHSKYGNIAESRDLDSMDQRIYDQKFGNENDNIDNADIVEEALARGNAVFQPNRVGVSTTNNAQLSNFNLGEPGIMSEYNIPQTNTITADEMLARKQQHRASINKKAIDGKIRSTKNIYKKYFENELEENERRVWWSAEAAEFSTDFDPSS